MNGYFVTGSDTGVGKTLVACALLHLLARRGVDAVGMKPVAAGADADGRNADVEALLAAGAAAPRRLVNPYSFAAAVAPHLAAAGEGREIRFAPILEACAELRRDHDVVIVEGIGGLLVPLGPDGDAADLARAMGLPLLLVVGLRLGCLNHALLSAEAIAARGLTLAGWVANAIDPAMALVEANIATLEARLAAPLLGVLPHLAPPDAVRAAGLLRLPAA